MTKYPDIMRIQEERERMKKLNEKYPLLQKAEYIKMYYELMTNKRNTEEQTQEYYYKLRSLF